MQGKEKKLRPSLREKKRYLIIETAGNAEDIERAVLDFIGVLGMAKAGLKIIEEKAGRIILAVNREMVNEVRAALALSDKLMRVVKVSGTLRKLNK